jgi:hypothetical protein
MRSLIPTQYCSVAQSEREEVVVACSTYGGEERSDVYRVMAGKLEGKRTLGKIKRNLEDNIKIDLQDVRCGGIDWIDLT